MYVDLSRDTTGVVLHKDSKWYQQWQEFKDNNPVVNGKYCLVPDIDSLFTFKIICIL